MTKDAQAKKGHAKTYSMRELRREFGVTARTLRFYEEKGLLSPTRKGVTRIFDDGDRARLKLTVRGKEFGFSIADIKKMLDLYHLNDGRVTQLRVAAQTMEEQLEDLSQQQVDLEKAIMRLKRTKRAISTMLRAREAKLSSA